MGDNNGRNANQRLIDFILAHKKEYVQDLLRKGNFKISGTKEELRARLKSLTEKEKISQDNLIKHLDGIEGYGNQHVYLFNIPDSHLNKLRNPEYLKSTCREHGLRGLYNSYKAHILPEKPKISSIEHSEDKFKIRWVVKRERLQLLGKSREQDSEKREILVKRYLSRKLRATTIFQVSLITGEAELLIHNLPSGSDTSYEEEKISYLQILDRWFNWGELPCMDLYPTISLIEKSSEVRTRNVGVRTSRGSHIGISSPSKKKGVYDDPDASRARESVESGVGDKGNFYWLHQVTNGALDRDIHTKIYENRISFFGECKEKEVNYVLGRIRRFV